MRKITEDSIPFTFIVPHKQHLAKIFRSIIPQCTYPDAKIKDNARIQNLPPGTVVDQGLVHPTIPEFYLQSHMTLKGTARALRFVILRNTNHNATLDGIASLTNQLCYAYQINNTACSYPGKS